MTANTKTEMRKFGITMAVVIALLFGLLLPWLFAYSYPFWPWPLAAVFLLTAFAVPRLLVPVYQGWMRVGHVLGWINSRIVLGLMFYTVFLFVAVFMKLLGKDPMARKFDATVDSYRVASEVRARDHLEKPF
jgi:hypothetical protein